MAALPKAFAEPSFALGPECLAGSSCWLTESLKDLRGTVPAALFKRVLGLCGNAGFGESDISCSLASKAGAAAVSAAASVPYRLVPAVSPGRLLLGVAAVLFRMAASKVG